MKPKINYLEKAKIRKDRQREKAAKRDLCKVQMGSYLLYRYVKTGCRKRSRILDHFNAWTAYVGETVYKLDCYQFNAFALDNTEAASLLFSALTTRVKNKKAIIADLAPICATY